MTVENSTNRLPWVLVFAIFLLVPSFDTALKYLGVRGVAAYFVVGSLMLALGHRFVLPMFRSALSEKQGNYLAIATFLLIAAAAVYVYPIANSGRFGSGSDADDALITAAKELLSGRYPYYLKTYLGNQISPMPGSVLLAIPFVFIGFIQLQNIFWLAVLFVSLRHFEKSSVSALGLLWTILISSPSVLQNILTGADYTANTIFILVSMWFLIRSVSNTDAAEWRRVLPAILFGIGLSSRSTFFLLLPLFLSILAQNSSWKTAIKYLSISAIVFLVVTVPFWAYDPGAFAPLNVQSSKLKAVEDFLPFASIIVPGSAILLSIALSLRKLESDGTRFFLYCAIVQLYVLLLTSAIYTMKQGKLDVFLGQTGYGMFTLFFGAVAGWMYLFPAQSGDDRIVEPG